MNTNEKVEVKSTTTVETPAVSGPLAIILSAGIVKIEFNGVESTTEEDKTAAIRMYIRNKVLKQFGIAEVEKNVVSAGKLYFNNGNRTALKLPTVKETPTGAFAEDLEMYYNRVKPAITRWLQQSFQNSVITADMVKAIG
jgi:hypothetical protein